MVPKLISYILSTMSHEVKDQIMAQPDYEHAIDGENVIELRDILERVFARQGIYSSVALRSKLILLRQEDKTFDAYVCEFQEILQMLNAVGVKLDDWNFLKVLSMLEGLNPCMTVIFACVLNMYSVIPRTVYEDVLRIWNIWTFSDETDKGG